MKRSFAGLLATLIACVSAARAEAPPVVAPGVPVGTGLQPTAIYRPNGAIWDPGAGLPTTQSGVTRTRTLCTLPAYASGGSAVCTDQAGAQTTTACAANTACQILPASANRRTFFLMNRTTGVTVDYGYSATVAPGTGIGIDGASTAGGQGAGFGETPAHLGAYFAAAPAAATVVIVQGQ